MPVKNERILFMKILCISLGCDKNLVDTERMLGLLNQEGYTFTDDETEADIIIINTCCFINDAKEESINTILEMAELKRRNDRQGIDCHRLLGPKISGRNPKGNTRGRWNFGNHCLS